METLRQLIFRDLEDGWSQDSDDTPTNETANEKSPFTDRPGAELADPAPGESPGQWGEEPVEAPDPAPSGQCGEVPVEAPDPAPSGQWGEEPVEAPPLEVLHSPVQVVRKGKRSRISSFIIIVLEQNISDSNVSDLSSVFTVLTRI